MATTTQLLKSAASRQAANLSYQDQLVDFQWSQSAKTQADYDAYVNYYNERMNASGSSPSNQLSFTKKIDTGRSTFTSHEIQRQSIQILEGTGSEQGKYDKLVSLYYASWENGDYDQAQSLRLQIDNQILKMQNQAAALALARSSYGGGGSGGSNVDLTNTKALYNAKEQDIKNGTSAMVFKASDGSLQQMPNIEVTDPITGKKEIVPFTYNYMNQIMQDRGTELPKILEYVQSLDPSKWPNGVLSPAQLLAASIEGAQVQLEAMIGTMDDPISQKEYKNKLYAFMTEANFNYNGLKLNAQEILEEAKLNSIGETMFFWSTDDNGKDVFIKGAVDDYRWELDAQGNPYLHKDYSDVSGEKTEFNLAANGKTALRYFIDKNGDYVAVDEGIINRLMGGDKTALDGLDKDTKNIYNNIKSGKGGTVDLDAILSKSGFIKVKDGIYQATNNVGKQLLAQFGIDDKRDLKIILDDGNGRPKFRVDDRLFEFDAKGGLREMVGQSVAQFIGGREVGKVTTSIDGLQAQTRDLQTNLPGGVLQKAQNTFQPAGTMGMNGTTGVLQQAAGIKSWQQWNVAEQERLRVEALPKAPPVAVYNPPPPPVYVQPPTVYQPGQIKVTTPAPAAATVTQGPAYTVKVDTPKPKGWGTLGNIQIG